MSGCYDFVITELTYFAYYEAKKNNLDIS